MPYQVPGHMVSKCFWIDVGKGNKHIRSSRTGANQPPEIIYFQVRKIYDACAGLYVKNCAASILLDMGDNSQYSCTGI